MVIYALHLLKTEPISSVSIHPDGEHGKRFDFADCLAKRGFSKVSKAGSTSYGGAYENLAGKTIVVNPTSGKGDVLVETDELHILAECKGGVINTRHPGQTSRLRKGLHEAVGLLMGKQTSGRQVAVVPFTEGTLKAASQLAPRCAQAGIHISLVKGCGEVFDIVGETFERTGNVESGAKKEK